MQLTLLTVVRNEEKRIKGFLDRHAPSFDRVVLVHDGKCLDETLGIARNYQNALVYERPGEHNPHPHRQWALENVIDGGWVAIHDADEELSDALLNDMHSLIEQAEAEGQDSISTIMEAYLDEVHIGSYPFYRIFKHSDRVQHPTHPHAGIEGLVNPRMTEYTFLNRNKAREIPSKVRRRSAILRRLIRRYPESPRLVAWREGMCIGNDYRSVLERKGIEIEVMGDPLMVIPAISEQVRDALREKVGVETLEELRWADVGYMARISGYDESYLGELQAAAAKLLEDSA